MRVLTVENMAAGLTFIRFLSRANRKECKEKDQMKVDEVVNEWLLDLVSGSFLFFNLDYVHLQSLLLVLQLSLVYLLDEFTTSLQSQSCDWPLTELHPLPTGALDLFLDRQTERGVSVATRMLPFHCFHCRKSSVKHVSGVETKGEMTLLMVVCVCVTLSCVCVCVLQTRWCLLRCTFHGVDVGAMLSHCRRSLPANPTSALAWQRNIKQPSSRCTSVAAAAGPQLTEALEL